MPSEAPRLNTLAGNGDNAPDLEIPPESGLFRKTWRADNLVRAGDLIENRYRVLNAAATGGMASVYVCDDTLLGRRVAVKTMRRDLSPEGRLAERFFGEARVTAQFENPHVARLYDYGLTSSGEPYMVIEFVDGPDLFSVLHLEGRRTPEEVVDYALQICEGLREAHRKGIVHCDLKPENLVRTRTPEGAAVVKIIDFGVSKSTTDPGLLPFVGSETLSGSPQYMSPEQIEKTAQVDARTDVWSLGVVMFELLTGRAPFPGSEHQGVCASVLNDAVPAPSSLLPGVSPQLEQTILRCLKKNRDERFPDVDELAASLSEVARGPVSGSGEAALALEDPKPARDEARTLPEQSHVGRRPSALWVLTRRALVSLVLAASALAGARADTPGAGESVDAVLDSPIVRHALF